MQAPVPRPGPRNEGRVNHNWSTPRTTLRISTHHTLVAAQMPNPRTTNHLCPVTVAVYVVVELWSVVSREKHLRTCVSDSVRLCLGRRRARAAPPRASRSSPRRSRRLAPARPSASLDSPPLALYPLLSLSLWPLPLDSDCACAVRCGLCGWVASTVHKNDLERGSPRRPENPIRSRCYTSE